MNKNYGELFENLKYNNDILESIIESMQAEQTIQLGGAKKCSIEKSDKIFFGNGGSSPIIIITKSKKVFKMIPAFHWRDSNESDINHNNKISETRLTNEINIIKILTKSIVNTNISPHFVKLIGVNECMNADDLFKECTNYIAYLKSKNKPQKCLQYFGGFPSKKLNGKFTTIELEFFPGSCSKLLQNLANETISNIKNALNKLFFPDILHTCCDSKKISIFYPLRFIHKKCTWNI